MSAELQAAANRVSTAIDEARRRPSESGDFERYGEALKELDAAMNAFQAAQRAAANGGAGASPGATPSPGADACADRFTRRLVGPSGLVGQIGAASVADAGGTPFCGSGDGVR